MDLDKIAKIEKAISEKYGEIAIENPKFCDIISKEEMSDISLALFQKEDDVFRGKQTNLIVDNKQCGFCSKYSIETRDSLYLTKYQSCFHCYIEHIEGRQESSWKPKLKNK